MLVITMLLAVRVIFVADIYMHNRPRITPSARTQISKKSANLTFKHTVARCSPDSPCVLVHELQPKSINLLKFHFPLQILGVCLRFPIICQLTSQASYGHSEGTHFIMLCFFKRPIEKEAQESIRLQSRDAQSRAFDLAHHPI